MAEELTVKVIEDYIPVYIVSLDGARYEVGHATDFDPETGEATVFLAEGFEYLFEQDVEFSIYV